MCPWLHLYLCFRHCVKHITSPSLSFFGLIDLLCKFKVYNLMIWYKHVLWNDYHNKINTFSTPITSHRYFFFFFFGVVRMFKIYSLRKLHYGHQSPWTQEHTLPRLGPLPRHPCGGRCNLSPRLNSGNKNSGIFFQQIEKLAERFGEGGTLTLGKSITGWQGNTGRIKHTLEFKKKMANTGDLLLENHLVQYFLKSF